MKSLRFSTALLFSIFFVPLSAQTRHIEKALFTCQFRERFALDTIARNFSVDTMYSEVGANSCSYYSYRRFYRDSVESTPDGKMKFMQEGLKNGAAGRIAWFIGHRGEYVYQNYPEGFTTTNKPGDRLKIVEERSVPVWTQLDSCRTIGGYECRLATTDFRGRRWSAWYAPDIPLSFGPWKLCGLPGFILEAYDQNRDYEFTIIRLVKTDSVDLVEYNPTNISYQKIDRAKYYKFIDRLSKMTLSERVALQSGSQKKMVDEVLKSVKSESSDEVVESRYKYGYLERDFSD